MLTVAGMTRANARCSPTAPLVRINMNIKVGCLLLFQSPVFFSVPPPLSLSLSLSLCLQLHCYKQESHCALLLSTEEERGKRDAGKDNCLEKRGDGVEERRGGTQRKGPRSVCVTPDFPHDTVNTGSLCTVKPCETIMILSLHPRKTEQPKAEILFLSTKDGVCCYKRVS